MCTRHLQTPYFVHHKTIKMGTKDKAPLPALRLKQHWVTFLQLTGTLQNLLILLYQMGSLLKDQALLRHTVEVIA